MPTTVDNPATPHVTPHADATPASPHDTLHRTGQHTGQHSPAHHAAVRRPGFGGLLLLASIVVSLLAASSAPTPLYAVYQREWGFSPITTTVVFGIYALSVLVSLLTAGTLSDHIGRRPVLITALVAQAVAMVVFTTAGGVPELIIGRVVQGLATGAALGAIGAGMLDIDQRRGTVANSVAPATGTGLGALVSALVVQELPAPTHLIYLVLLVVFALQAVGVLLLPETASRRPGALASLTPEVRLPKTLRGSVLTVTPVLFAVWSLAGFYGSLAPALVRQLSGSGSAVLSGLPLFELAGVAAVTVFVLRSVRAHRVMLMGILSLVLGVALTVVAVAVPSTAVFFVGTGIAGVGFGAGFQGGMRLVLPQVATHDRSAVLSLLYLVSYLGLGLPAVIAGVLVVHAGGLTTTAQEYSGFVIVLAVIALVALLGGQLRGRRSA